jgi:hypothetical protein
MASLRQQLQDLIATLAPDMQKAFIASIDDIKSEIVLKEVVERLERRDIEGAIAALHIQSSAFRSLGETIRQAFNAGGALVAKAMPKLADFLGARVVWRWDIGNQRAEANIRDLSSAARLRRRRKQRGRPLSLPLLKGRDRSPSHSTLSGARAP